MTSKDNIHQLYKIWQHQLTPSYRFPAKCAKDDGVLDLDDSINKKSRDRKLKRTSQLDVLQTVMKVVNRFQKHRKTQLKSSGKSDVSNNDQTSCLSAVSVSGSYKSDVTVSVSRM